MKSTLAKHSMVIHGHKTSVSLEEAFWIGLKGIAKGQRIPLSEMVSGIDKRRVAGNLSSALRLFVYSNACAEVGVTSTDNVNENATTRAAASIAQQ
jgi:predicted DNA-binding ribbon-helix-helix protein